MKSCGPAFWVEKAAQAKLQNLQDATATAVYFALVRLHNDRGSPDWFPASSAGIANVAAVSKRAVFAKLPLLKSAGLILLKSGKSNSANKAHVMNHFALVWCSANDAQGDAPDAQALMHTSRASFAGYKEHLGNLKEFPTGVLGASAPAQGAQGYAPDGNDWD